MFRLSIGLAIIAIIAAVLGFGGIAAGFATFAKVIFFIALALLAINLITGAVKG